MAWRTADEDVDGGSYFGGGSVSSGGENCSLTTTAPLCCGGNSSGSSCASSKDGKLGTLPLGVSPLVVTIAVGQAPHAIMGMSLGYPWVADKEGEVFRRDRK